MSIPFKTACTHVPRNQDIASNHITTRTTSPGPSFPISSSRSMHLRQSRGVDSRSKTLMEATQTTSMVGGISDVPGSENSSELEELARFAVEEYNKKENSLLEFAGLVNAKKQVVAGTMYYLTVEVNEGGQKKLYAAKVWVKPWLNFKQLEEFKPLGDSASQ